MKQSAQKLHLARFCCPLVWAAMLFLFLPHAKAVIDATLQMQLGNPTGATADPNNTNHYLIQRTVEAIDYNATLNLPNWASWDLSASDVGPVSRSPVFFTDTNLPPGFYEVTPIDYNGVGAINFDRGHMCPSEDRTDTTNDNQMTFYMSNIVPQAANNNEIMWANFESYCRTIAQAGNEVLITCGPSGFGTNYIPSGKVPIPSNVWKIAVVVPLGSGTALSRVGVSNRVIAINTPNENSVTNSWQTYLTTASQIERDTGFTFFTALAPEVASALRYKLDGIASPPPVVTGFSPLSGSVNADVVITGTNFTSALAVKFNGRSSSYTVDSPTQITAKVPTNATSGVITVVTADGTANSGAGFTAIGSSNADLAIWLTHSGNFTQGNVAVTYTLIVSNLGNISTLGTVSVSDQLPASLAAAAMTGSGWATDLQALTCTRSEALAPGAAYPPIILTVNVATNAPSSLTNSASVSSAGEINLLNNTAADPTTILPASSGSFVYTGVIAGWDVSTVTNFGPSPLAPTTNAPNISVVGLTRGSGVATNNNGAARAWGGIAFTNTASSSASGANQFAFFSVTANPGCTISVTAISKFDYRRSSTGPPSGLLQYQIGSAPFADVTNVSYTSTSSSGGSLGPFDVSAIAALQNVGAGTNITFRIVNYGGSSTGTWYIFDVANSTALDFGIQGSVQSAVVLTPLQTWRQQWFGTTNNSGSAADNFVGSSDGMANLLKYALGLNPLIAAANPITGDISSGYLRLSAPRNPSATDVTFTAEVSGDVHTWTTTGTVIDENSSTLFQAHDATPVPATSQRFIRLRVTNP